VAERPCEVEGWPAQFLGHRGLMLAIRATSSSKACRSFLAFLRERWAFLTAIRQPASHASLPIPRPSAAMRDRQHICTGSVALVHDDERKLAERVFAKASEVNGPARSGESLILCTACRNASSNFTPAGRLRSRYQAKAPRYSSSASG
jgi:hypothetical protein